MKHILIVDLEDDSKCWGCPCLNEYGNCDAIPSTPGGAEIIDYIRPDDCPLIQVGHLKISGEDFLIYQRDYLYENLDREIELLKWRAR